MRLIVSSAENIQQLLDPETGKTTQALSLSIVHDADAGWRVTLTVGRNIVFNDLQRSAEGALASAMRATKNQDLRTVVAGLDPAEDQVEAFQAISDQARWRLQREHQPPELDPLELGIVHDVPNRVFRIFVENDVRSPRREWCPPIAISEPDQLVKTIERARELGGDLRDEMIHQIRACPSSRPALDPDAYMQGRKTRWIPQRYLGHVVCRGPEATFQFARVTTTDELSLRLWAIEHQRSACLAFPLNPAVLQTRNFDGRDSWETLRQQPTKTLRQLHDHTRHLRDRMSAESSDFRDQDRRQRIDELEFARRVVARALGPRLGAERLRDGQPFVSGAAAARDLEGFLPLTAAPERARHVGAR